MRDPAVVKALQESADIARAHAADVDKLSRFPVEAIDSLKNAGLLSCAIGEESGGMGLTLSELSEVCVALGQCCGSTAMIFAMHQIQIACLKRHHGDSTYLQDFLVQCVSEKTLIASATSEKGIGGNIRSSIAALSSVDDNVSLKKNCTTISYGEFADAILVTARKSPEAAASDQVLTLLRKSEYSIDRTTEWDALGMRGTCSSGFLLAGSTSRRSVIPADFRTISGLTMTPYAHILWASVWLGIATDAVDTARSLYINTKAVDHKLSFSESRLVAARSKLDSFRAIVQTAVADYQNPSLNQNSAQYMLAINNVKLRSSQLAVEACLDAMFYCGFAGYSNVSDYSIARNLRDSISAPIMIANDRIAETNASLLLIAG